MLVISLPFGDESNRIFITKIIPETSVKKSLILCIWFAFIVVTFFFDRLLCGELNKIKTISEKLAMTFLIDDFPLKSLVHLQHQNHLVSHILIAHQQ